VAARSSGAGAVYLLGPEMAEVLPNSLEALRSGFLVKSETAPPDAGSHAEPETSPGAESPGELATPAPD
jgi:hypothetical protein